MESMNTQIFGLVHQFFPASRFKLRTIFFSAAACMSLCCVNMPFYAICVQLNEIPFGKNNKPTKHTSKKTLFIFLPKYLFGWIKAIPCILKPMSLLFAVHTTQRIQFVYSIPGCSFSLFAIYLWNAIVIPICYLFVLNAVDQFQCNIPLHIFSTFIWCKSNIPYFSFCIHVYM